MTKMNMFKIIKTVAFLGIVGLLLLAVRNICIPDDVIKEQNILYEEESENSIDIAFVGSSSTYRFYDVMEIWGQYGITTMCYYNPSLPFDSVIPMLELVQENQDPEVVVIDLRNIITDEYKMKYLGAYETDSQKEAYLDALNLLTDVGVKLEAIEDSVYTEDESYVYILDILYNHSAFAQGVANLFEEGGEIEAMNFKGNYMAYIYDDLTDEYVDFDLIEENEDYELTEDTVERLTELLEYCDEEEINAYFTITPYIHSKGIVDQDIRREFGELVESYGYPYADYREEIEEIGFDFTTDFYDTTHANALGAEKYSIYAMEDILEVYDVDATYDQEVIDSWNKEYEDWVEYDEYRTDNITAR